MNRKDFLQENSPDRLIIITNAVPAAQSTSPLSGNQGCYTMSLEANFKASHVSLLLL